jgi:hypothetical protein
MQSMACGQHGHKFLLQQLIVGASATLHVRVQARKNSTHQNSFLAILLAPCT